MEQRKSREVRPPRLGGRSRLQQFRRPHRSRSDPQGRPQGARSRHHLLRRRPTPTATARQLRDVPRRDRSATAARTSCWRPSSRGRWTTAGRFQGASRRYIMAEVEASLQTAQDRLDRSLPAAPAGSADADRGDLAGARRSRRGRARSATSAARPCRPGRSSRRSGRRGITASTTSSRARRSTACWRAGSIAR